MRFELDPHALPPVVARIRRYHWAALAVAVAGAVGVTWTAIERLRGFGSDRTSELYLGLWVFFLGYSLVGVALTGPGPTGVDVGTAGFTLRYAGGRTQHVAWGKPGLRLQFARRAVPVDPASGRFSVVALLGSLPLYRFLTLAAFEEIVRSARAAGGEVTELAPTASGLVRTRIRFP